MPNCCCFYCISTKEAGIVESLGKFDHISDPGCHFLNCVTQTLRGVVSLRVQVIKCHVESKTMDNAIVRVSFSVHYKVIETNIESAFYRFTNPAQQIESFAANVIRGQVPKHTVDEIFLIRDEMQKALREELEEQMASFGFNIVATLITDIDPSNEIKQAMSQIVTNARLRIAAGYEAETNKIKVIKAAEAESEAKRLSGVGLAEQRKAAILGLQSSVKNFSSNVNGMTSSDIMGLLMMNQYFDAIKDVASNGKCTVVFLPGVNAHTTIDAVMAAETGQNFGGGGQTGKKMA